MTSYRNPIVPGFNPDPSIIRVGEDYFLCTSTFEYFPAVPIYHSRDLISWNLIGHALTRRSQLDLRTLPPGIGICAPTLRYHNKRYYMTTCCMWKLFGRPGDVSSALDQADIC
jgi:beta-xylosidase